MLPFARAGGPAFRALGYDLLGGSGGSYKLETMAIPIRASFRVL